jgi:drug/metabolite transporter (DMT)-like permease
MNARIVVGAVLLVVGIILLYLGYQSSQGLDDQVSEAITGDFTDSTVWYWIAGAASGVAGAMMLLRGR